MLKFFVLGLAASVLAGCSTVSSDKAFGPSDPRAMVVLATDALDGDDAVASSDHFFHKIGADGQSFDGESFRISAASMFPRMRLPSPADGLPGLQFFVGWAAPGDHVLVASANEESANFEFVSCGSNGARVLRFPAGRVSIVTADKYGYRLKDEAGALAAAQRALDQHGGIAGAAALAETIGEAKFPTGKTIFGEPNCIPSGPVSVTANRTH